MKISKSYIVMIAIVFLLGTLIVVKYSDLSGYGVIFHFKYKNETCCQIAAKHKLEVLCPKEDKNVDSSYNCTCTDYMLCKLVMVTAISNNHYNESQDFFGSVHRNMPGTKIIVYDLGLTMNQLEELHSYCNVEVRLFDYNKYPNHTKDLTIYAWKPLIVKEVSLEFELVMYGDASCRIRKPLAGYLTFLTEFPFLLGSSLGRNVILTTHEGMLKYLKMNMSRAQLVKHDTIEANFIIWITESIERNFLSHWVDCAMHRECIAPKGSGKYGCNFKIPHDDGTYVGCHRYDQSALNMILIREFGELWNDTIARTRPYSRKYIRINRSVTSKYVSNICKSSANVSSTVSPNH